MKKGLIAVCLIALMVSVLATQAGAHFGMVIPSDAMVMQEDSRTINVSLSFSHPFEMIGMPLVRPEKFFVVTADKQVDLKSTLEKIKVMDHDAWQTGYAIKFPGLYTFCMEPVPYWEPAEDCFIIHYTYPAALFFSRQCA